MSSVNKLNVRCFIANVFFFRLLFVPLMLLFVVKTTRSHICFSLLYNVDHANVSLNHKVISTFNGAACICVLTVDKLTKTDGDHISWHCQWLLIHHIFYFSYHEYMGLTNWVHIFCVSEYPGQIQPWCTPAHQCRESVSESPTWWVFVFFFNTWDEIYSTGFWTIIFKDHLSNFCIDFLTLPSRTCNSEVVSWKRMFHVRVEFCFGVMSHDTVWVITNVLKERAVCFLSKDGSRFLATLVASYQTTRCHSHNTSVWALANFPTCCLEIIVAETDSFSDIYLARLFVANRVVSFRICRVGWCGDADKNKSGTGRILVNITEGMRHF